VLVGVEETLIANRQARLLRGPARKAYDRFLDDLQSRGCAALQYRVTGPDELPYLCVAHLRAADRAVVAFVSPSRAWVLLVGRHTDNPATDVYELLYAWAGARPEPETRRRKPACCDRTGAAPVAGVYIVESLVWAAKRLAR
jgi:hypothetical protein